MKSITMVKYTTEQIDRILVMLESIVRDSKAFDCSLSMMSVMLDINNYLRENAVVFEEENKESTPDIECTGNDTAEKNDIVLAGGDANVL